MSSVFAYNGKILLTQNRKALTLGSGRRLPDEYQEVEWIGSTKGGGQYISTGYTGSECIVTCKTKFVEQPTGLAYIFGRYSSTATQVLGLMSGSAATVFRVGMGPGVNSIVPLDTNVHTIVLNAFTMQYAIDSEIGSLGSSLIGEDGRDICLFVNHTSSMASPSYANIYEFKIEDATGIALNLVPCYRISDNVIGMYDIVSNRFLTNSGSGTFTKGADV